MYLNNYGTLKSQRNKIEMTPQNFHTISTSCAILPTMHITKLSRCALDYAHPYSYISTTHSALHSTAFLHIGQPISPISAMLSIAISQQPPTTQLIHHAHQHALHTQHSTPFQNPPIYAHNNCKT